jgi:hypothetical protein
VDEAAALRIRDRMLYRLEHADSKQSTALDILRECPDAELGVALQEIPSYLEANQVPTEFVEDILKDRCPEVAAKAAKLWKASQVRAIGHETAVQISRGIRTAAPPHVLMKPERVRKYDPQM